MKFVFGYIQEGGNQDVKIFFFFGSLLVLCELHFFQNFLFFTDCFFFCFFFISASSLNGQKDSIYSLALNTMGTVLISGSTEKVKLIDLVNSSRHGF